MYMDGSMEFVSKNRQVELINAVSIRLTRRVRVLPGAHDAVTSVPAEVGQASLRVTPGDRISRYCRCE
ncbi:hypothetical protein BHM03_00038700 [Ensete ventricosum]|nr:hypothetical protein BHM03_00038700 [Ensete ventricosum]